jgi:hypothetical protein
MSHAYHRGSSCSAAYAGQTGGEGNEVLHVLRMQVLQVQVLQGAGIQTQMVLHNQPATSRPNHHIVDEARSGTTPVRWVSKISDGGRGQLKWRLEVLRCASSWAITCPSADASRALRRLEAGGGRSLATRG